MNDKQNIPKNIEQGIGKLQDKGYAIVIFTPEELEGVDNGYVEGRITEYAWEVIIDAIKENEEFNNE
jgi:hypothetical protein